MKRRDALYCCVCTREISAERLVKQSVTCSKACAAQLRNIRRRKHDAHKCRYCNQPSTPEERAQFRKWREAQGTKRKRGRPSKNAMPNGQASFTDYIHIS